MSTTNRQLVFTKERELHWREIPIPTISDRGSALVRPFIVARSDLDVIALCPSETSSVRLKNLKQDAIANIAKRIHLDRFTAPAPVGQQCIAEIVETGPDVLGLPRGKRVVVPAKVSCGSCARCMVGMTAQCEEFDSDAVFGLLDKPSVSGGLLCDLVRIPNAAKLLVPLPDSLEPLLLSSAGSDLGDAWCSLMPYLHNLKSARVLVIGGAARSTALYALALASNQQVETLDYIDNSAERVAIAAALGANAVEKAPKRNRRTYDVIVSGSTDPGLVRQLLGQLIPGGVIIQLLPQLIGDEKIPLDQLYENNLTLVTTKSHVRANLRSLLDNLVSNPLDLKSICTHIGDFENAHKHFIKNTTKVVVQRPQLYKRA